jgi:hypothetical protein
MSEVASKAMQAGMARGFAVAFSVMVAVALLITTASATLAATAPPAPVIVSPPEGSYDNDGAFTLSGTAPTNSVVKVFEVVSGRTNYQGIAQVSATGEWALPLQGVGDGKHAYKAKVTDLASSLVSNWSNTRTVTVDTIPGAPAAPYLLPHFNDTPLGSGGFASGTAEPNSKVELFVTDSAMKTTSLGTVQADGQGNWSKEFPISTWEMGAYFFKARATDLAGNVSGWSEERGTSLLILDGVRSFID